MLNQFLKTIEIKQRAKKTMEGLEYMLTHAQECLKKPLEKADWNNIMDYLIMLRDTEELSESTIALHQTKLRQFYTFCFDETDEPKFLKISKKLKTSIPKTKFNPVDILLPEDIKRLINVATLERDRCIVATLFESGMRLGELLALTRSMVQMDEEHQTVTFNIPDIEGCKTGGRTVVCIEIYGYVQDWLKCNPSDQFMPVGRRTINDILQRLFGKANIKKPANPHAFRHASITHCVNIGMQQNAIGQRFWGNVSTNMLKTYISLSEQMQAGAYKIAKGMGEVNGKTVINPLASRCVECGRLIQSGNLCKTCMNSKKLSDENQELKDKLNSMENLINLIAAKVDIGDLPRQIGMVKKFQKKEEGLG